MNMPLDNISYCHQILPQVSRTFAIGIELLNDPLKQEICVAYLICRILDTLEDTSCLPAKQRVLLLNRIAKQAFEKKDWQDCIRQIELFFTGHHLNGCDYELCRKASLVFEIFHDFPDSTQKAMVPSMVEMAKGMAKMVDMETHPVGVCLDAISDLDQYCYYIAGTAGILLTNLFGLRRSSIHAIKHQLTGLAVAFGRGLQITNIIKDMDEDSKRGVCYIPKTVINEVQEIVKSLPDSSNAMAREKTVEKMSCFALEGLDQAVQYTVMIPSREKDIRMFCGLPVLFAVKTLSLILQNKAARSTENLKISREQVADIYQQLESIIDQDSPFIQYYLQERPAINKSLLCNKL